MSVFPAGWIYDRTGKYTASFLAAGVPPIIGALFMLCIYRVRGNDDLADRFDGVANGGGGGRSGLEEDEALIENAVSGMDKVRPRLLIFIKLLHAQYFYFIFLSFNEYTKSTMMQMCQIWMNVLVLVNSSFYSNNLGKFPLHSSVYITLKSKMSG